MTLALCLITFFTSATIYALGQRSGFKQGCELWRPFAEEAVDAMPEVRRASLLDAIAIIREQRTNLPGHSYDLALTHAEDEVRRLMEGER